jgi:GNAT superfamily N-acetyltransferase
MTNDLIDCRTMGGPERFDALRLMQTFRSDESRLSEALALFVEREDYGFVWLAYRADEAVGCASVGYAISTAAGGLVGLVRDLYVVPAQRRSGVATTLLAALEARLAALDVAGLELAAAGDPALAAFASARGFRLAAGLFAVHR